VSKLKNKLMLIQCTALVASLSSLFVGVFAWYTANRQVSVSVSSITTEQGMAVTMYKFVDNSNAAKNAVYKVGTEGSSIYVNGQQSEKTSIGFASTNTCYFAETSEVSISVSNFAPTYRTTYAFKITNGFATDSLIRFQMTKFISQASTSAYSQAASYNANSNQGIRLAEAINIYSSCYTYDNDTNLDAAAKSFVSSSSLYNKNYFSYLASYGTDQDLTLNNSGAADEYFSGDFDLSSGFARNSTGSNTLYFFLTIEFSNDSSSFYDNTPVTLPTYSNSTANAVADSVFYVKNTSGSSNAYSSLAANVPFTVKELYFVKDDNTSSVTLDSKGGTTTSDRLNYGETLPTLASKSDGEGNTWNFADWYDEINKTTYAGGASLPTSISTLHSLFAEYTKQS
jgi:hypothetical protein